MKVLAPAFSLSAGPSIDKKGHAMFKNFVRDQSGATAMEYGLVVALVCLVVGTAVQFAGAALWRRLLEVSAQF